MKKAPVRPNKRTRAVARPSERPAAARRSAVPSAASAAPSESRHRSQGREQLIGLADNAAAIGRKIGCARATVSAYVTGSKTPSPRARVALELHYGIPARAWAEVARKPERAPRTAPPLPPEADAPPELEADDADDADDNLGDVGEVDELLATIREARRDPRLLPSERIRASSEERALIALRARLEHLAATRDSEIAKLCIRHPRWIEHKRAIIAAIRPHREAMLAVAALLREYGVEEST